jgi:tripeptidyl-peptidase-1
MRFFLCLFAALAAAVSASMVHMERGMFDSRDDFSSVGNADGAKVHEVVFAVRQKNLD